MSKTLEERIIERLAKDLFAYAGYSYSEGARPVYGEEVAEGKFTTVDVTEVKRGGPTAKFVVGKPRVVYDKNIARKVFSELDLVNKIIKALESAARKRRQK